MSEDGKQLGVVDTREALRIAGDAGLDLVEVAADAGSAVSQPRRNGLTLTPALSALSHDIPGFFILG